MGSELIDGFRISLIGMSLTFLALGLVILVMVVLVRLFPERSRTDRPTPPVSLIDDDKVDQKRREELAAAIAVSVCLQERDRSGEYRDPSLGELLEK
ncbi:MAG: OadG-related small transporter subunit [Candidatus Promineifilaceae bacterium]|jgi:Na+-transporting methylmalonyl-CoA/oxaloacetate decarboxylase gamma subunit